MRETAPRVNGKTAVASKSNLPGIISDPKATLPAINGSSRDIKVASVNALDGYRVIRRTGQVVPFEVAKIYAAIKSAFVAVGADGDIDAQLEPIVTRAIDALRRSSALTFGIEQIQDQVELALLRSGNIKVGVAYANYRAERAEKRRHKANLLVPEAFSVIDEAGASSTVDPAAIYARLETASQGLTDVDCELLLTRVVSSIHSGISMEAFDRALVLEASTMIEAHPNYSYMAARLMMDAVASEVAGTKLSRAQTVKQYPDLFVKMIKRGVNAKRLNPKLNKLFDLGQLAAAIKPERDLQIDFLGMQTLYDRYFVKVDGRRIELPQLLWMRVAMGLAIQEENPTKRAIEFYELLSSFRFMNSTPTLFNSGTVFAQLSSCYLSTVGDDLSQIYGAVKDNALLAKFAGGLGNDWTPVRAQGSKIDSTGGKSQGVVPFLRVVNDTALAVNQGGKRNGAVCCYLETWHRDIREFIELRKNTGDERRRTHDMNTANWIPDLFFKRVAAKGQWTLFSPSDVPDLHELYGLEFEQAYCAYEQQVVAGKIDGEQIDAFKLWQQMVRMLYETGHPWITFKDPCNLRSPQRHAGVIHSSNLCTEITLNTSADEIAVCNLGSVNLVRHLDENNELDKTKLRATVRTAMRMLDNVIDINYYAVDKAKNSNSQHRPIGLGQAGFQDCLYQKGVSFASEEAVEFADISTEMIAYYAYEASADLASERGSYQSYEGSTWSKGILPLDTIHTLGKHRHGGNELPVEDGWLRGTDLVMNVESKMDWEALRKKIKRTGMRNSNCLAIAPTATISNIMGISPCIEPTYKNFFVKTNLSGNFKLINKHLVRDLQEAKLWGDEMISAIKARDGEIEDIEQIPIELRMRYKTAFNIEGKWLIAAAARRQKWLDQSQSLNLFVAAPSGRKISDLYFLAWRSGLKTTYYCRSSSASLTEKFTTTNTGQQNNVAVPEQRQDASSCALDDPECEACQ